MSENIYIRFLNKLEEIEYKSIQWGYTAGTLSEDELYDEADKFSILCSKCTRLLG